MEIDDQDTQYGKLKDKLYYPELGPRVLHAERCAGCDWRRAGEGWEHVACNKCGWFSWKRYPHGE